MREPDDPSSSSAIADQPGRFPALSAIPVPLPEDVIVGTEGADSLQGTANADTINGLGGDDTIRGLGGDDVVNGDAGNDVLEGGVNGSRDLDPGNDALFGGDGDDFLRNGPGVDAFDGGAGFDRISFLLLGATQGVVANLATQTISNDGFGNAEAMTSVEGLGAGTVFADILIGDDNVNLFFGDVGDMLTGAGGDDFFGISGAPASIDGGAGIDAILLFGLSKTVPDTNGDGFADTVFATHGVIVDLSTQSIVDDGFGGVGALTSIERVGGSLEGDAITGNDQQDWLTGYTGGDQLNGGAGADTLFGDGGADTLNGGDGDDVLHGGGVSGIALGSGGITRLPGAGNVDFATALDISNEFIGGDIACNMQVQASGDGAVHVYKINLLNFGASATITPLSLSGAPIRVSVFDSVGHQVGVTSATNVIATVNAPAGPDKLAPQPGVHYIVVAAPNGAGLLAGQNYFLNVAVANELDFGADTLNGGAGADLMIGGWGNDVYFVDDLGDTIVEVAPAGQIVDGLHLVDSVNASVSYTLAANLENLALLDGALDGTGNDQDNIVEGNAAANQLTGGAGDDELSGHDGDDTLIGGAGADILDGDFGNDTMIGGLGDDFYVVMDVGDVVSEDDVAGGVDTVTAFVSFSLASAGFVENLTLFDALFAPNALNAVGNDLINVITGNAAANQLFGLAGNDTLDGGAGADSLFGGEGDDLYIVDNAADFAFEGNVAWGLDLVQASVSYQLGQNIDNLTLVGAALVGNGNLLANVIVGNANANTLFGMAGNDTLDGAANADQMFGGLGDDLYIVDDSADFTFEAQTAWGLDTVQASVDYQLGQNIDNLVLQSGAGALTGRGNILNNIITGNESANTLFGFAGNDTLNGGLGADQLYGREGDDAYIVDNVGDVVAEANAAWGTDTIFASVTYFLSPNIEHLALTGAANINGNGNGLNNTLTGNSGANNLFGQLGNDTLDGGAGADSLFGGEGDDLYIVDNAGDVGFEASAAWGIDLVQASVTHILGTNRDNLTLTGASAINATGNNLANVLTGNSAANALFGLGGADTLNGGAGNDALDGGAGDDVFVFAPGTGSDTVTGFVAGGAEDSINLSAYNGSGVTWSIAQVGADTVFSFTNGDQITLSGVTAANLVQDPLDPFFYG